VVVEVRLGENADNSITSSSSAIDVEDVLNECARAFLTWVLMGWVLAVAISGRLLEGAVWAKIGGVSGGLIGVLGGVSVGGGEEEGKDRGGEAGGLAGAAEAGAPQTDPVATTKKCGNKNREKHLPKKEPSQTTAREWQKQTPARE
jgi:hypothetical protein